MREVPIFGICEVLDRAPMLVKMFGKRAAYFYLVVIALRAPLWTGAFLWIALRLRQ